MAQSVPHLIVLDVNETLSDLSGMPDRFEEVGAPRHLAPLWFASVLRDGFALATAETRATFAELAEQNLRGLLAPLGLEDPAEAVDTVMAGFGEMDVHPDVGPGLEALRALRIQLVTLSNGSAAVAHGLLDRAGLADAVDDVLSVEGQSWWKPAREAYSQPLAVRDVAAEDAMLVAVHPWDVDGAARAGLRTAWIDRAGGTPWPDAFTPPEITASSLVDLAEQLESP